MFKSRAPRARGGQPTRRTVDSAEDDEVTVIKRARGSAGAPSLLSASTATKKTSGGSARSGLLEGGERMEGDGRGQGLTFHRGGSYSMEELERLKAEQMFKSRSAAVEDEVVELTGEEAEAMEQQMEGDVATSFNDERTDFQRRLKLKISSIAKRTDSERVYLTTARNTPEFIPLSEVDEAGEEWEQSVVKRGLRIAAHEDVENSALNRLNEVSSVRVSEIRRTFRKTVDSIEDIQVALAEAVDSLREHLARNQRRQETVASDTSSLLREETELRDQLERRISLINDLREFRLFCSDLVAMLREKAPLVNDLKMALVQLRSELSSRLFASRVVFQEDLVFRVKEAGLLIQLGSQYSPSAVLLGSGDSTLVSVGGRGTLLEEREGLFAAFTHWRIEEGYAIEAYGIYTGSEDAALYSRRVLELQDAHRMVFEDARPEMYDIEALLNIMKAFLLKYPEKFSVAYIAHSLIGLLEPLVLHDLCLLDFLGEEVRLSSRSWYSFLVAFDSTLESQSSVKAGDAPKLLPQVIPIWYDIEV